MNYRKQLQTVNEKTKIVLYLCDIETQIMYTFFDGNQFEADIPSWMSDFISTKQTTLYFEQDGQKKHYFKWYLDKTNVVVLLDETQHPMLTSVLTFLITGSHLDDKAERNAELAKAKERENSLRIKLEVEQLRREQDKFEVVKSKDIITDLKTQNYTQVLKLKEITAMNIELSKRLGKIEQSSDMDSLNNKLTDDNKKLLSEVKNVNDIAQRWEARYKQLENRYITLHSSAKEIVNRAKQQRSASTLAPSATKSPLQQSTQQKVERITKLSASTSDSPSPSMSTTSRHDGLDVKSNATTSHNTDRRNISNEAHSGALLNNDKDRLNNTVNNKARTNHEYLGDNNLNNTGTPIINTHELSASNQNISSTGAQSIDTKKPNSQKPGIYYTPDGRAMYNFVPDYADANKEASADNFNLTVGGASNEGFDYSGAHYATKTNDKFNVPLAKGTTNQVKGGEVINTSTLTQADNLDLSLGIARISESFGYTGEQYKNDNTKYTVTLDNVPTLNISSTDAPILTTGIGDVSAKFDYSGDGYATPKKEVYQLGNISNIEKESSSDYTDKGIRTSTTTRQDSGFQLGTQLEVQTSQHKIDPPNKMDRVISALNHIIESGSAEHINLDTFASVTAMPTKLALVNTPSSVKSVIAKLIGLERSGKLTPFQLRQLNEAIKKY